MTMGSETGGNGNHRSLPLGTPQSRSYRSIALLRSTLALAAAAGLAVAQPNDALPTEPEPAGDPAVQPELVETATDPGGDAVEPVETPAETLIETQFEPDPLDALGPPSAPRAERLGKASAMLGSLDDPEIARAVTRAIVEGPPDARRLFLQAIDAAPPPEALRGAILNLARQSSAPATDRAAALTIAARFYDRETAAAILEIAGAEQDPATKAVAYQSLRELSGRDDLGDDSGAWAAWLRQAYALNEVEWESAVSRRLHARLLDRDRELAVATAQLIDAYRRLNLARDPADRPTLQAELLRSPMRPLRELGFELVNRELAESRRPGEVVERAAIALLDSPYPEERERAAVLLGRLAPDSAREPLIAALEEETNPKTASAMLRVARRWPGPRVVSCALIWLESDKGAVPAAAEALLTMDEAGLLGQADRDRIAIALAGVSPSRWTEPMARLLARAGDDRQRELIAAQLDAPEPATRLMAARALESRPEYVDRLLDAAMRDTALYEPAVRAVTTHRPTVEGYRAIAELPDPGDGSRDAALASVIAAMPISELNRAATQLASGPEQREKLLSDLERPARQETLTAGDFERYERGVLMLAGARIDLGRPASALDALDLLSPAAPATDVAQRTALRATALIMLDELDQAQELGASADVWLDALQRSAELPHAADVHERVESLFGSTLTPDQMARLRDLGEQIDQANSEDTDEQSRGDRGLQTLRS